MDVVSGPRHAYTVKNIKFSDTQSHCCNSPDARFNISILLAYFHHWRDIHIYLCVLTVSLIGQKPSPSQISQQKQLQVPLSAIGSQYYLYHLQSLLTGDHGSNLHFGCILCSYWGPNELAQQLTIQYGLLERLHQQLKAALKSHPNPPHWSDLLPPGYWYIIERGHPMKLCWAGIQSTLHLPGECCDNAWYDETMEPAAYVTWPKSDMPQLQATPVCQ